MLKNSRHLLLGLLLCAIHQSYSQLHFVSLGSYGTGSFSQTTVGSLLRLTAKDNAVSFLVSPGSNFIGGVQSLNDTKWTNSYEKPYAGSSMNLPFFTVLGTEDWKGNYTALALRANMTYDVGKEDFPANHVPFPKWTLPNWWYHYSTHFSDSSAINAAYGSSDGSVGFVFIDTYILSKRFRYQNITKLHWDNLRDLVTEAVTIFDWVVVVGDKAMVSSGSSAGDPYLSETLRPFLKEIKVDVYISGNDHNLEVIEDGPLLHVNCGAGSDGKSAGRLNDNSVLYVGKPGFCLHTVTKKHFGTEFFDGDLGGVAGNHTKIRNIRDRALLDRFHIYKTLPQIVYVPIPKGAGLGERPAGGPRGVVPNTGPGSEGGPPAEGDLFVRVVGTLGLLIAVGLTGLASVVAGHKLSRG